MTAAPTRRRRITVISPFRPRRTSRHGAPQVIYGLVSRLAERHDVKVITTVATVRTVRPIHPDLEQIEIPRPQAHPHLVRLRRFVGLLRGRSPWATDWYSPQLVERVRAEASKQHCDLVQVEFLLLADTVAGARGQVPVIVTVHDPPVAEAARRCRDAPWTQKPLRALEWQAWVRTLRRAAKVATMIVVFDDHDRVEVMRTTGSTPVRSLSYPIDLPPVPADPAGTGSPSICFVGSYHHLPNVEAVVTLVDEVMPKLWERHPTLRLVVVGADPPRVASHPSADPRIVTTGFVADLQSVMDEASIVVAPIRSGGGMRVKVLHALALGKAVVGTPRAAAGLPAEALDTMVVADDDDFAAAVDALLDDRQRRIELGRAARTWAAEWLAPGGFEARYEQLVEEAERLWEAGRR